MEIVNTMQAWALVALGVVLFLVEVFAFVEALRGSAVMYQAHGKLTKPIWVAITAIAAVLGFVSFQFPIGLPGILAIVAAGVFLADVRPLVRPGSSKNNDGPYGPW